MKKHYLNFKNKTLLITILTVLFFVLKVQSQSFQIRWSMDYTLAGTSDHANFTANNATLMGGTNTYGLASIYSAGGAIGLAYIVRPWPASFSAGRNMDFTFSANQYEYHINSFSFRLRRSDTGPKEVKIRSSADGFSSDLYTLPLPSANVFYSVSVPVSFINLANTSFSFRIYGFNPSNVTLGVLWFDEIKLNGLVTNFVLPVNLTYFTVNQQEDMVALAWETAWEQNSKEFVIERSENLSEFATIGRVEGAGAATGRLQYNFYDEAPLAGTSYYRLKMVDNDGNYSYSKVREVTIHSEVQSLVVSPNPSSPFYIRIAKGDFDPSQLCLTNVSGRNILYDIEEFEGNYISIIPREALSAGLYVLSLFQNGKKLHSKVLVR